MNDQLNFTLFLINLPSRQNSVIAQIPLFIDISALLIEALAIGYLEIW
jgi:hypothetical protein